MNNLNFKTPGGFPLSTNILDAMQTAYMVFNALGNIAGNFAIISGCTESGSQVSDGVVFINGELVEFRGGGVSSTVTIKEDVETRVFENGSTNPVIYKRYATFGSSTPDKTFSWADFKRIFPTTAIEPFRKNFEDRIKALEQRKSPIPIGMIAIWNKPADVPIPDGWQECTDLRGRFPLGWNPDDADFAELGKMDGEKVHTLSKDEMPSHDHVTHAKGSFSGYYLNNTNKAYSKGDGGHDFGGTQTPSTVVRTGDTGGGQPHNNMPPYRIIKFIEFVGF